MITFLSQYGVECDDIVDASVYTKGMIFESCLDALGSGEATPDLITTSSSYSHSIILELLDNAKEFLLKLAQQVLSMLNNFYLNNVKLVDKYREIILDRLPANAPIIMHETYAYPDTKDYPKDMKSTAGAEGEIKRLHEDLLADPTISVAFRVDKLIEKFGKEVLGMTPDPNNLKDSTAEIVRKTVRGEVVKIQISRKTLGEYIDQISSYKKDKDDLLRTKKNIVEDYETLKRTYSKVTKDPMELAKDRVAKLKNPDKEALLSHEYQRFVNIHMQMTRLFNGYITIYKTAFDTKLNEITQKVEDRKNVINEIITRTGLFAKLNTKNPDRYGNPIPYKPGLEL